MPETWFPHFYVGLDSVLNAAFKIIAFSPIIRKRTCCCEGVTPLGQDLHWVISKITPGQIQTKDCVGKGIALVDGNSMGDTISTVEDNAWNSTSI